MKFTELEINEQLLQGIEEMGFVEMTEIQERAIPQLMMGGDLIGKSQTGTGKTVAFAIPAITKLDPSIKKVQVLVLCPTRELAVQVSDEFRKVIKYFKGVKVLPIFGGASIENQIRDLKSGVQIVVGTPGRVMDHMRRKTLKLTDVSMVVLDEADEMLNMGFYKDVRKILDTIKSKQVLAMFSATISREVMDIGWLYQRDAEEITVQPIENSQPKIKQYSILTTGRNKLADMAELIVKNGYKRVMVFCNTKYTTAMLANQLADLNFHADCLHGDLSQVERNKIMGEFKAGNIPILIATDVAARGIDVSDVDVVFNYDVPQSNEFYTHRIGRTGRAKQEGVAYLLYTKEERQRVRDMLRYTRNEVDPIAFDEDRNVVAGEF